MRSDSQYCAALILGSALLLAMGVTHPSTIPLGDDAALARMAFMGALAHSLAILGTWLVLVGLVGLSRMLGLERVAVVAALVAFALAASGAVVAATVDGFVVPKLAQQWMGVDNTARDNLRQLMQLCVLVASSLTRIYLLLGAVAIALWSWVIYTERLTQALPWVGAMVGIAAIALLFGGPAYLSVHELLALVVGQTVWMVLAGFLMVRRGGAT